jgi:hypothetical protein
MPGPSSCPYSPKCVEGEFSEVRIAPVQHPCPLAEVVGLRGPGLYNAPYRRKEAWVEENHRRKAKPGPVLGLAGVTTLAGVMLFVLAIHRVSHSVWSKATIAFLMGVVALIIAGRLYAAWLSLRQGGNRGTGS